MSSWSEHFREQKQQAADSAIRNQAHFPLSLSGFSALLTLCALTRRGGDRRLWAILRQNCGWNLKVPAAHCNQPPGRDVPWGLVTVQPAPSGEMRITPSVYLYSAKSKGSLRSAHPDY